jgi:hypothetical protein
MSKKIKTKCVCLTLKGQPCKGKVKSGGEYCSVHLVKPCLLRTVVKKQSLKKTEVHDEKQASEMYQVKKMSLKKRLEAKEVKPSTKKSLEKSPTKTSQKKTSVKEIQTPRPKKVSDVYDMKYILQRADIWRDLTTKGYQFPHWLIPYFEKYPDVLHSYLLQTKVYVDHPFDLPTVISLVKEREPVNIEREQRYNKKELEIEFGWQDGFYDRYFNTFKKLAPNIAVYTPCLFRLPLSMMDDDTKSTMKEDFEELKILNVIGLAFDSKEQSDYKYFLGDVRKPKFDEISLHYYRVFRKIFRCAKDNDIQTIALPPFGLGFFAKHYPKVADIEIQNNDKSLINIFANALKDAQVQFSFRGQIQLMGFQFHQVKTIQSIASNIIYGPELGYFPKNTLNVIDLATTLWVNAWDPLSAPGNGCEGDSSLDGWMGRTTSIAITGNGALNPYLQVPEHFINV